MEEMEAGALETLTLCREEEQRRDFARVGAGLPKESPLTPRRRLVFFAFDARNERRENPKQNKHFGRHDHY